MSFLQNPVYHALLTGDRHLNAGTETVAFFEETVSPFAGFDENYEQGFDDLYNFLPAGRKILFASPFHINNPEGWQLLQAVSGQQMLLQKNYHTDSTEVKLTLLSSQHIIEMMKLAALTKPGPFGPRTIDFGHYYGVFQKNRLVAMTGQRLHAGHYTEISAVCTHPDFTGRGYAVALLQQAIAVIHHQGRIPFLHVRKDNDRAIALYERMGFETSRPMNFYFMKRL